MNDKEVEEIVAEVDAPPDEQGDVIEGDKWLKSRKCGCGDCRFFSLEERLVCPMENAPSAIWLWIMNPSFIGMKDYVDTFGTSLVSPDDVLAEIESLDSQEAEVD